MHLSQVPGKPVTTSVMSAFEEDPNLYQPWVVDGFGARPLYEARKIHAIEQMLQCAICKALVDGYYSPLAS